MKYLIIPSIPLLAIYGSQQLGAHITSTPLACITAGICVFTVTFAAFFYWVSHT